MSEAELIETPFSTRASVPHELATLLPVDIRAYTTKGFGNATCPLAHLVVRTAADYAKSQGLSYATLFVDIKAAFATTLRELIIPAHVDNELHVVALLRQRGFPHEEARTIVDEGQQAQAWGNASLHMKHVVSSVSANQPLSLLHIISCR